MGTHHQSKAFLIYEFRILSSRLLEFQEWAEKKGMHFWEGHDGVIRYRTFRKLSEPELEQHLGEQSAPIHGISQIEAKGIDSLKRIITLPEFKAIHQEFISFVEPDSLQYSLLECAYDSAE